MHSLSFILFLPQHLSQVDTCLFTWRGRERIRERERMRMRELQRQERRRVKEPGSEKEEGWATRNTPWMKTESTSTSFSFPSRQTFCFSLSYRFFGYSSCPSYLSTNLLFSRGTQIQSVYLWRKTPFSLSFFSEYCLMVSVPFVVCYSCSFSLSPSLWPEWQIGGVYLTGKKRERETETGRGDDYWWWWWKHSVWKRFKSLSLREREENEGKEEALSVSSVCFVSVSLDVTSERESKSKVAQSKASSTDDHPSLLLLMSRVLNASLSFPLICPWMNFPSSPSSLSPMFCQFPLNSLLFSTDDNNEEREREDRIGLKVTAAVM